MRKLFKNQKGFVKQRVCGKNNAGFTLLEILLVVAAIAILAGIVILAINPGKQLGDTRNAQRHSDTNTILNAVYQYAIDNNGTLPGGIDTATTTSQVLGTGTAGLDTTCTATTTVAAAVDFKASLVPTYIVGIPTDPQTGMASNTDYFINKTQDGRIVVGACDPESGVVIMKTK